MCAFVAKIYPDKVVRLCDGAQVAIFGDILRPVFSASRVQHFQTCILNSH